MRQVTLPTETNTRRSPRYERMTLAERRAHTANARKARDEWYRRARELMAQDAAREDLPVS